MGCASNVVAEANDPRVESSLEHSLDLRGAETVLCDTSTCVQQVGPRHMVGETLAREFVPRALAKL